MSNRLIRLLPATLLLAMVTPLVLAQDDGPSRLEFSGALHRLEQFEQRCDRANGAPFELGHTEREALERIARLKRAYPDNPEVEDLYQRARICLMKSKGQGLEVTDELTEYRRKSDQLIAAFRELAEEEWASIIESITADDNAITDVFPAPDPMEVSMEDVVGNRIVLGDIEYPMNMFKHLGQSYIAVGGGARGIYYVNVSGRGWRGAYEAVRRYRRQIGGEIPLQVKWTVAGTVSGVLLAVPEAGEETVGDAQFGWVIDVDAIMIPGFSVTLAADNELGGLFVGEDRLEEIKGPLYTLHEVPDDASPEEMVDAWITTIKERNYELWLSLLDPARRETGNQMEVVRYHWDWHMKRWWDTYVHYEIVDEPEIELVRGEEIDETEAFFLSEEERAELLARAEPVERRAVFKIRLFDERGRQFRTPQNFYLRQYGDDGRWWVDGPHLPN